MRPTDRLGAAALAYANLGYRVLPLHHPIATNSIQGRGMLCSCGDCACGAVGKHPLTSHGLNDATSDPAKLTRWWRRWPQANIGLVTGEVADVLDIDGPAGRAALRRFAAAHDLRLEGPLVRTGSGWHLYLAPTGTRNRAGLLAYVDWRGRGGYVVAPPSRHASGRCYRWLRPLTAELSAAPVPLHSLLDPCPSPPISAGACGTVPPDRCWPSLRPHRACAGTVRRRPRPQRSPQHHPVPGWNSSLQPGRRRRPRPRRGRGWPARRRGNLPAPGRGASPNPPHSHLCRANRAQSSPRRPSPQPARPLGTGPKVEPAATRSGGSRAGWLTPS